MKKETLIILIGFALVLLPSLGIPDEWKKVVTVIVGVLLLLLGYLLIRDKFRAQTDMGNGERGADTFIETTGSLFSEE